MENNGITKDSQNNFYSDKKELPAPTGRAIFTNLAKPTQKYGRYSISILVPKTDKENLPWLKAIKADYARVAQAKWGGTIPATAALPAIYDGDTQPASQDDSTPIGEKYAAFKGMWYIRLGSKDRIRTVDAQGKDIDAALILPGMLVDATVQVMAVKQGCSLKANVVRLIKDDKVRLYTQADPVKMLKPLADDDDSALETPAADELDDATESLAEAPKKKTAKKSALAEAADTL